MWVIRRTTDGKFVARPGAPSSYTQFLQFAMSYNTKEKALGCCCVENEHVVSVDSILYSQNTFGD